jgi:AcrR family transcriptional regulator
MALLCKEECCMTATRILTESARLFATKGYGSTTTRDIAAHVGITQPGLYRHFASKDEILKSLFDLALGLPFRVAAQLERIEAPASWRLYRFLYDSSMHLSQTPFALAAILHTRELQAPRFSRQHKQLRRLDRLVEKLIRSGIDEGDFLLCPTASTTLMIIEMTNVFALEKHARSMVDELVAFVFNALLIRRSRLLAIRRGALQIAVQLEAVERSDGGDR